jgi:carbamoyl-phosphate synthase large subunit
MTLLNEIRAEPLRDRAKLAVLLTSAGQRVALVHNLRTAGEALGIRVRVIACDRSPRSRPACLVADAAYQTNDPFDADYINSILEICVIHRVGLIIPTDSAEMLVLSQNRNRFNAIGVSVAASGPELSAMASDPIEVQTFTRELLERHDIPLIGAGEVQETDRRFEVLMYFDGSGALTTVIPCERLAQEGVEHLITRHSPCMEALARRIAERLDEPRSVISFDATIRRDGTIEVEALRAHFGETFEIAHLAGAQVIRWLLNEHCFGEMAPVAEWREGVEMFRYEAAMFVLPR